MVGLIKTQAGSLVAALALCALPLGGRQTQRIPALGAVRLAGGSDGLSITATSFDGTITTWLVEAEADGEVAMRLEGLADLVRHFPADAEIAIAADDRAATVTSGRSRFKLPVFPIADLLALARFVAVVDPQSRTHVVSLRWDAGGLHLGADGSADCLAADVEGEGETAVQIRYLAELTGALRGDSIRLNVGEPGGMILVTDPEDENFFAGQMPIRPRSS